MAAVLLLAVLAGRAAGDSTYGVQGTVTNGSSPVVGAEVLVFASGDGSLVAWGWSDGAGQFYVGLPDQGDYKAAVVAPSGNCAFYRGQATITGADPFGVGWHGEPNWVTRDLDNTWPASTCPVPAPTPTPTATPTPTPTATPTPTPTATAEPSATGCDLGHGSPCPSVGPTATAGPVGPVEISSFTGGALDELNLIVFALVVSSSLLLVASTANLVLEMRRR